MSIDVLIADDDGDLPAFISAKFKDKYNLYFAQNGIEALEILKQHSNIKIILADYYMPEMGGLELLSEATRLSPYNKTIIIGGKKC